MSQGTRLCVDCGADLSDRPAQTRRCHPCAAVDKHRPRARGPRQCLDCGVDIAERHWSAKRCKPCADAARRASNAGVPKCPRPHTCRRCGASFIRRRSDTQFCRPDCWRRFQLDANRVDHTRLCGWCGHEFTPVRSDAVCCGHKRTRAYWYLRNAQKAKRRAWEWAVANPEQRRQIANVNRGKRRAAHIAGPGVAVADWRALVRRFGGCAYCGAAGPLHMDHVVPIARGGRHSIGNVLPACAPCNLGKGALLLAEWRLRQRRSSPPRANEKGLRP